MRSDTELADLIEEYQNCFYEKFHRYPDISTRETGCLAQVLKRSNSLSKAIELVDFYFTLNGEKDWFVRNAWAPEVLLDKFNYVVAQLGSSEHRHQAIRAIRIQNRLTNLMWTLKNSTYCQDAFGLVRNRDGTITKGGVAQTDAQLEAMLRKRFVID